MPDSNQRGRRYSEEEKREIVEYVYRVNAERGRGGLTEAAKQFNVSPPTISGWLRRYGRLVRNQDDQELSRQTVERGKILDQLVALAREIAARRKELAALEARFEELKASL